LASLAASVVALIQARSPLNASCWWPDALADEAGRPDGRPCESADHGRGEEDPGEDYLCERPGPSHHIRRPWSGSLPWVSCKIQRLALALGIALPLRWRSSHTPISGTPAAADRLVLITLAVVVWTQSAHGPVSLSGGSGAYLTKRVNWKSLLAAAGAGAPALLLGDVRAAKRMKSSMERLEAWERRHEMFRSSPVWEWASRISSSTTTSGPQHLRAGSGRAWFRRTVLWAAVFYTASRSSYWPSVAIAVAPTHRAYVWARALLASLSGIAVGTTFLSWAITRWCGPSWPCPCVLPSCPRSRSGISCLLRRARSDGYYGDRRVVAGSLARLSSGARVL